MTFLDFFSGIGGFRLGMEQAGHTCKGHVEIDKFANKSYIAMHEPKEDEFFADDIRNVRPEDLPEVDIYCGGFPCQSFSVAGQRGGFEDTRGTLFFEIMRLASVRKPKYIFLENVPGLLSHDGGRTFGTILQTLWEFGYNAEWQLLNSWYFGVGQNRERIYIVAYLREKTTTGIFPIEKSSDWDFKTIQKFIRGKRKNCSGCLTTRQKQYGRHELDTLIYGYKNNTVRVLTPKECFRLQGFPDEYFECAQAVNSDTQLYKQAGNSVTVPVIYEIAKKLGDK